jgi:competence ComEA-like helix-hairpin-helix protein
LYKKKEIIIIIVILIATILFAFWDDLFKKREETIINSEQIYVSVKLEGEVKKEIEIKIPYGYTYGYVMKYAELYLNDYSYYELDLKKAIYENTVITILTIDKNNNYNEEIKGININTATKKELLLVYGIGEARADKIIKYRENDRIDTFNELKELLGVSDEIISRIKTQAVLQ